MEGVDAARDRLVWTLVGTGPEYSAPQKMRRPTQPSGNSKFASAGTLSPKKRVNLSDYWLFAVLVAGTILIYYAALDYGFLIFDDNRHISSNALITQPGFANLIKFWTGTFFDLFVPVVYTVW